ncbi:ABC transporter permease [Paenibacillus sp. y28]|uniref:ABC transporter permease n=1 Tax=Paenibacillus sp. y28 TaxID=3129110 RepID=UPI0030188E65
MRIPKRNAGQTIMYWIGLYRLYLRIYFRTLAEYRADTLIALGGGVLAQGSTLLFLTVILQRVPQLAGWGFYELVFLLGMTSAGRALNMVFLNAPFTISGLVRRGLIDVLMVRPVGVLFQAVGITQEINGIGQSITGIAIMVYAAWHMNIDWTAWMVLYAVIAMVSSMFIQFSIQLFIVVASFWVQEIRSVIYPATWVFDFARYPMDIFGPIVRGFLTYVLPYAFCSFYPAAYLLRSDLEYAWAAWGVPLLAVLITLFAYRWWLFGLRRYSSASG